MVYRLLQIDLKTTLTCSERAKSRYNKQKYNIQNQGSIMEPLSTNIQKLIWQFGGKTESFCISTTLNSLAFGLFCDEFQTIQTEIWLNYDYLPQQSQSL